MKPPHKDVGSLWLALNPLGEEILAQMIREGIRSAMRSPKWRSNRPDDAEARGAHDEEMSVITTELPEGWGPIPKHMQGYPRFSFSSARISDGLYKEFIVDLS